MASGPSLRRSSAVSPSCNRAISSGWCIKSMSLNKPICIGRKGRNQLIKGGASNRCHSTNQSVQKEKTQIGYKCCIKSISLNKPICIGRKDRNQQIMVHQIDVTQINTFIIVLSNGLPVCLPTFLTVCLSVCLINNVNLSVQPFLIRFVVEIVFFFHHLYACPDVIARNKSASFNCFLFQFMR